jgi:hypothetical protein
MKTLRLCWAHSSGARKMVGVFGTRRSDLLCLFSRREDQLEKFISIEPKKIKKNMATFSRGPSLALKVPWAVGVEICCEKKT